MQRQLVVFGIVFCLCIFSVSSLTFFNITETDLLSLHVNASDPDGDPLWFIFDSPLNTSGQWQTTYGDSGVHKLNISVSDGNLTTTQEILIVVAVKQEPPSVTFFEPQHRDLDITEGDSIGFMIQAGDINDDALRYEWYLDGAVVSNQSQILFRSGYHDQGSHEVSVVITDGVHQIQVDWNLSVANIPLDELLFDQFTDSNYTENDIISLNLPDFSYYQLNYTLSGPLSENYWETDYDSAGSYPVVLTASGQGYQEQKTIIITVENLDRPPEITPLGNFYVYEQSTLSFSPSAQDPDNETVTISAKSLPKGATFEDGVFTWTPSYQVVQSQGPLVNAFGKFHLLNAKHESVFTVKSGEYTTELIVPIIVLQTNRAPTLRPIASTTLREGERFILNVSAIDPDNDKLNFIFDGWLDHGQTIPYDQQGIHYVKVSASDGFLEDSHYVKVEVENVNRAPTIENIKERTVEENETIDIVLQGTDPDGDTLRYSLQDAPTGAYIENNRFIWTPSFDATSSSFVTQYNIKVVASDGHLVDSTTLSINVENVNQPPQTEHENLHFVGEVNTPVLLSVNAFDADGDNVTVEWDFGLFDKHPGLVHERTFISPGVKKAKVMVSDGEARITRDVSISIT